MPREPFRWGGVGGNVEAVQHARLPRDKPLIIQISITGNIKFYRKLKHISITESEFLNNISQILVEFPNLQRGPPQCGVQANVIIQKSTLQYSLEPSAAWVLQANVIVYKITVKYSLERPALVGHFVFIHGYHSGRANHVNDACSHGNSRCCHRNWGKYAATCQASIT